MRADNEGEGGIMALASLAMSAVRKHRTAALIMAFGVIGAALFYGDGMITPAVSVLSAVEGLELVAPSLSSYVVPIALVLLIGLFLVQRYGTHRVGMAFGPIMLVWFAVIGVLGLVSLVQTPQVLASINPMYAVSFIAAEPWVAFLALGSVVLCVTGAEALYADMGQFGRSPIRLSWFVVAAPCLYLNYLGQGALILRDPSTADNSFYLLVPSVAQLPMVILATMATIIASQAVISGAFSMTQQAIRLGYLPRMTVLHTSASERGQVYVPFVNWMLMVAIIGLVIGFQDSSNLAAAYGIAVTGTFLITTCLITVVARHVWNLSWAKVAPLAVLFFIIDGAFFAANLTKFSHGGWFPLVAAAVIFTVLSIWRWGWDRMMTRLSDLQVPMSDLAEVIDSEGVSVSPGSLIYVTIEDGVPYALVQRARTFHSVSERTLIIRLVTTETPRVSDDERLEVISDDGSLIDVRAAYGFMERPDPVAVVQRVSAWGTGIDPETCVYSFYSARVEVGPSPLPVHVAAEIFAFMQRNSTDPQRYYHLAPERVIEVGRLVAI
ncbi:MAG: potassium transporter Kup, partial [Candidatus Nanopelagicales bacterium]